MSDLSLSDLGIKSARETTHQDLWDRLLVRFRNVGRRKVLRLYKQSNIFEIHYWIYLKLTHRWVHFEKLFAKIYVG